MEQIINELTDLGAEYSKLLNTMVDTHNNDYGTDYYNGYGDDFHKSISAIIDKLRKAT